MGIVLQTRDLSGNRTLPWCVAGRAPTRFQTWARQRAIGWPDTTFPAAASQIASGDAALHAAPTGRICSMQTPASPGWRTGLEQRTAILRGARSHLRQAMLAGYGCYHSCSRRADRHCQTGSWGWSLLSSSLSLTSQSWNRTFSFYQSLRTVLRDPDEPSRLRMAAVLAPRCLIRYAGPRMDHDEEPRLPVRSRHRSRACAPRHFLLACAAWDTPYRAARSPAKYGTGFGWASTSMPLRSFRVPRRAAFNGPSFVTIGMNYPSFVDLSPALPRR